MNTAAIDDILARGTAIQDDGSRVLPGVVVMAADLKKDISYTKTSGVRSLAEAEATPLEVDGVYFIASMTKLMTAVAAMQCVERGLIGLDDDVSSVLHEWKDAEVLEGFDDSGKPKLRKAKNKITLRLLLCHSSGIGYDLLDPKLMEWRKYHGQEPGALSGSIQRGFTCPLVFEPGEGWAYGGGLDWAGQLVERLNGGIRLGEYLEQHIWGPLGMTSTTFNVHKRQDLAARQVSMSARIPTGQTIPLPTPILPSPAEDDLGGVGSYSTAPDFMKLTTTLLRKDGKILKASTIDEMFKPQLPNPKYLEEIVSDPEQRRLLASNIPPGVKVDYGLGGMINLDATGTGRQAGSMQWGGLPNLFWWIDPKSGVCATYFSQLMPPGDPKSLELLKEFETAFYHVK